MYVQLYRTYALFLVCYENYISYESYFISFLGFSNAGKNNLRHNYLLALLTLYNIPRTFYISKRQMPLRCRRVSAGERHGASHVANRLPGGHRAGHLQRVATRRTPDAVLSAQLANRWELRPSVIIQKLEIYPANTPFAT